VVVAGLAAHDRLTGEFGADTLTGGTGADSFIYTALLDSTVNEAGRDTILDFSPKQGDKIDLSAIDANPALDEDEAFTFVGTSAFSGAAGEVQVRAGTGRTFVDADVNGDGVADFSIELKGVVALTGIDFVL
jgi:Ca2+-binding RTX toxin-like protein